MFRGVLFRRFMENRGFWYSALWSSLFFVLMHQDGAQMAYALLLGIFLCYVYEKFGSLKAPVLLHVAANCSSLLYTELGVFRWIGGAPVRMAGCGYRGRVCLLGDVCADPEDRGTCEEGKRARNRRYTRSRVNKKQF